MERSKTIIEILLIPAISSEKDLIKRSSSIPNFDQYLFPRLNKKQVKAFQKGSLFTFHQIKEIFSTNSIEITFNKDKLSQLPSIITKGLTDRILLHHFGLFVLYQYIDYLLLFETDFDSESTVLLFNSLLLFEELDFQSLIYSAITDVLTIIIDNYTSDLFSTIFPQFSDFLLSHKDLDESFFTFLPMFLKREMDENGLSSSSNSGKIASLITLLLSRNSKTFTPDAINLLFVLIRPFMQRSNEFALVMMHYMLPQLDQDKVNTFFLDLPSCFPQIIEQHESPLISPPDEIEYESFTPSPSPECQFRFPPFVTFKSGIDVSTTPQVQVPSLKNLVHSDILYIVDLVLKVIGSQSYGAVLFLDALTDLVNQKGNSKYKYDYIGLMIVFWVKITNNLPIERLKMPKTLFEPILSTFKNQSGVFFSIRYYAINSLLKIANPHLDVFLLEYVKYPCLFTEIVEICNLNLDKISTLIMNQGTMIRTLRLIGLQLQNAEFTNTISVDCIEGARLAVFRLLFRIFSQQSFVFLFLKDILFLSFFLSLLFEKNVRPFILPHLKAYISSNLSDEKKEQYMMQICQIIEQVYGVLPQRHAVDLISDILSSLSLSKIKPSLMIDLCRVLQGAIGFLDDSDMSRFVLLQIINFFTIVSKGTQHLPKTCITSLEKPLTKFEDLCENDFNVCLCLLASDQLTSYTPTFIISNGCMMNVMFRVFYSNSSIDLLKFISDLCHFSENNCTILHHSFFDLTLLDFLMENRESDDPKIPRILDIISIIASVISSPAVVQRFISLFIPLDSRYLSKIHHLLLKPLLTIIQKAQICPSLTISLNRKYEQTISSKAQFDKEGFAFTFWIYYKSCENLNIFSLLNGEHKTIFSIGLNQNIFTINSSLTTVSLPKEQWKFVFVSYQNGTVRFYIDNTHISQIDNVSLKFTLGVSTLQVGGAKYAKIRLGNFGLYDSFDSSIVKTVYELGPRSIQIMKKPLLYYTQVNLRQLPQYRNDMETRTFADILFKFFKLEIFLPLFAQLDLPLKTGEASNFDVHDVVSVFKATLFVGEIEQMDFEKVQGFAIISHLLCSSSPSLATYALYFSFYEILDILISEDLKKELFVQIIMNFDLWAPASPDEHIMILKHWNKILLDRYKGMFIELFPFSYLLDILRIYYWYDPIEKTKIRGEPNSRRPRNPNLNITDCRAQLNSIMTMILETQFRNEDFSALMEHIITLEDDKQRLDLLLFMNGLAFATRDPLSKLTNAIQTITRLSSLIPSKDDQIVSAIINVIFSVHCNSRSSSGGLTLGQHLDAIIQYIEIRSITENFLENSLNLLNRTTKLLFPICSYVSYRLKQIDMYKTLEPAAEFATIPNWAIWSIFEAITNHNEKERIAIFKFLARCSHKQWLTLFNTIEIIAFSCGDYFCTDDYKEELLTVFCNMVIESPSNLANVNVSQLFLLLKQHLFYRINIEDHSGYFMNDGLWKLFEDSPFCNELPPKQPKMSFSQKEIFQSDILQLTLDAHEYIFGLRIGDNGEWLDEDLAQLTLNLILKYRKNVDELGFGLVLAGFLLTSKQGSYVYNSSINSETAAPDDADYITIQSNPEPVCHTLSNAEFVNHWLNALKLCREDCENHKIESQFLVAKAEMVNVNLNIKTQLNQAFSGMAQLLELLPKEFYDNAIANSYVCTHREMKAFSQQAANNMFMVQGQEERNIEYENDIHLATEKIRVNVEKNSKLWQRLWSNVAVDGAPWDISKVAGKRDKARWKRDITLCRYKCPMKMKPNRKYTNHYQSSIARDAGNQQNLQRIIEEYKQHLLDEYKKNAPPELLEIQSTIIDETTSNHHSSANVSNTQSKKKKRKEYKCELIKIMGVFQGTFSVYGGAIHIDIESTKKAYVLPTSMIKKILLRRRFHIKTAIEIFMRSGETYFLNFPQYRSVEILQRFVVPEQVFVQRDEPSIFFHQTGYTERWKQGKMSNFEYLMKLNIYSGRSFNDSSQYPFFPWVIADYTSETLDLNNPASFRDLSKPLGAIDEKRFNELVKRMKDMKTFGSSPYLYSSFAICPLSLYLWLFRIEPFTTLHIDMQSGRFDHPSRLFSSIPDSYSIVSTNLNDYRELIPEFYFLPEFLRNDNELDLGKNKGVPVGDVILPKWAKSCEDCVYMFRKALESDHVSNTLHKWIDLIWGYKQRGEKAHESHNLYMPDMYETAWTPQVLKDPRRRAEIEAAMCHVGQFPPQIFLNEHPKKNVDKTISSTQVTLIKLPYDNIRTARLVYKNNLMLLLVTENNEVASLEFKRSSNVANSTQSQSQGNSNQNQNEVSSNPIILVNEPKFIGNYQIVHLESMEGSNDIIGLLENGQIIEVYNGDITLFHQELRRVSMISCSKEFIGAVSNDTTLNLIGKCIPGYSIPFYGNSISCCALSHSFKIAVCGTASGDIVVSSLYEGEKINVIKLGKEYLPTKLLITKSWGFIVTYAVKNSIGTEKAKQYLFVHNVNGRFIRSVELTSPIICWCTFSSNQAFDYLVISNDQGKLNLFEAFYLNIGESFYRCYTPVIDLMYLKDFKMIAAVKSDGNVVFHPICIQ